MNISYMGFGISLQTSTSESLPCGVWARSKTVPPQLRAIHESFLFYTQNPTMTTYAYGETRKFENQLYD